MYPGIRRGRSRTLYNTQRGCGKFAVVVAAAAAGGGQPGYRARVVRPASGLLAAASS